MSIKFTLFFFAGIQLSVLGAGIYRDGVGARAMGLGGADVAWAEGPLGAFGNNPAGLMRLEHAAVDVGFTTIIPDGEFRNDASGTTSLRTPVGAWPEIALAASWDRVQCA